MNAVEIAKRYLEDIERDDENEKHPRSYAPTNWVLHKPELRQLCEAVLEANKTFKYALGPTRDVKTPKFYQWLQNHGDEK